MSNSLFKEYISLRPQHTKYSDSPFCLQPAIKVNNKVWFKNQPVGVATAELVTLLSAEGAPLIKFDIFFCCVSRLSSNNYLCPLST